MVQKNPRPYIKQRKTVLAVGEGKADTAFLYHLRQLYCSDKKGASISIRNAQGKGPSNVISTAIGASKIQQFDQILCLLDTDLDWPLKDIARAKQKNIILIGSEPCLEGLLLNILERGGVLETSSDCKAELQQFTGHTMLKPEHYTQHFSHPTLQEARCRILELDNLIKLFAGG